ncbi:hypothetical protein OPS25_07845 [Alteromonas ponticola]|uniref:Uncharacterized protein n=1 Tax=Alteromonas aquimaris TaxID=2998417 RepID=A0ABT3P6L4_9ALTE|nr:hypothetical protein [Alteromonas aquimaris]MCW8108403.1 hypothetical protein [Alteromonas aquimaris]
MKHLKLTKQLQTAGVIVLILAITIFFLIHKSERQGKILHQPLSNGLGNQCQFVNSECTIKLENQIFQVSLSRPPIVEERIDITIASTESFELEGAVIEGVNMYMGRLPVVLSPAEKNEWRGWFMLGACSEAKMRWQMIIKIKGQRQPALILFTTES